MLAYLEHVAERHDLYRDISFGTQMTSAVYEDQNWRLSFGDGSEVVVPFVVAAVGYLSARYFPPIPGLKDGTFAGPVVHTGSWPKEGVEVAGKRVALIGTGASGVQVIPLVTREAEHLYVYQRSPNWRVPLHNCPMPQEYMARIKGQYDELRQAEDESLAGYTLVDFRLPGPQERRRRQSALTVSAEKREREYEYRWRSGGLCFTNSFRDLITDEDANATLRDFVARKVREIVDDPDIAERLIPKDHPILSKRLCGESGYYEAFNRDNVTLVDTRADPIAEITATGLRLESSEEHELDVIACATGYDAATGSLLRLDIRGRDGRNLKEHWARGTRTHLGAMSHGFPNLFFLDGPQSPGAFFSPPLLTQYQARWVGRIIERLGETGHRAVEPTAEAEIAWAQEIDRLANRTLIPKASSQLMGDNVEDKPRECLYYVGGFANYSRRCEEALDPARGELAWTYGGGQGP